MSFCKSLSPSRAQLSSCILVGITVHHIQSLYAIQSVQIYGNHSWVGKAIKDSGVPREEIFLTSKVSPFEQGLEQAPTAARGFLKQLGTFSCSVLVRSWYCGCGILLPFMVLRGYSNSVPLASECIAQYSHREQRPDWDTIALTIVCTQKNALCFQMTHTIIHNCWV